MKLTWYGHSCFMLSDGESSIVFDPYAPGSVPGCSLPELTADKVICSHGHSDHNYEAGVKLSGKPCAFALTQLKSFHDNVKGVLRGKNLITVAEKDGVRVAHLGDLGHELDAAQLASLGRIDVLLIPVGGFFTIDAKTAKAVADAIDPTVVVPMHYRGEGFGYDVIGTLDSFLALTDNAQLLGSDEWEIDLHAKKTVVFGKN